MYLYFGSSVKLAKILSILCNVSLFFFLFLFFFCNRVLSQAYDLFFGVNFFFCSGIWICIFVFSVLFFGFCGVYAQCGFLKMVDFCVIGGWYLGVCYVMVFF